jgi:serine phosphatase RsbU (regulator of sigma subunit)
LTTETLLKDTNNVAALRRRTKEEEEEEEEEDVDERLATVLDRVSRLSERYQTVLERTRRQKKVLENARRCDVDVVRANEGNECDFQAVLKTEAYVKR